MSSLHTSEKIEGIFSKMHFNGERRFMEPMKNHSSLKIGGPADVFIMPVDQVVRVRTGEKGLEAL